MNLPPVRVQYSTLARALERAMTRWFPPVWRMMVWSIPAPRIVTALSMRSSEVRVKVSAERERMSPFSAAA